MIVKFDGNECIITKEKGDRRYTRGYAEAESGFLYTLLQHIKKMGHDVIKKRMWKDGHMVDETHQYIRTRKIEKGFAIWNNCYAFYDAGEKFNSLKVGESMDLSVQRF